MINFRSLIEEVGTRSAARACGVSPNAVNLWKRQGRLPNRKGLTRGRRVHYEKALAKLAGIPVKELRQALAEEERQAG